MSKYRTIINMSPSFIKVMPFKCTGVNLLKLESYTNRFTNVHEGLVCIFKAENTNTGPVRIKLSDLSNELKLLDVNGNEVPAGFIKANMYLQASYDGTNLVLHNDNSNIDLEAGSNIIIDKKPDGTVVVSAVNTNTWRPITDSLENDDSNISASAKVAKLLNDKILAITTIVNDNKVLQDNIADTVIEILTEIDNLKLIDSELTKKINDVNGKVDTNIREITSIKAELANKADANHTHGNATTSANGFMTKEDKTKLDGVSAGANNYIHPNDENTRHVTDAEKAAWNSKADGSHGHGNSTTSTDGFMSKEDKTKLDGVSAGANNYVHPNDINTRHVTDAEKAAWNSKADGSHGHGNATTSANGFMTKEDKTKLDGVSAGANNYVHPNDINTRHVTDAEKAAWNAKADGNHGHSSVESSTYVAINNTENKSHGRMQMFQMASNTTINPGSGWYSTLRMQHSGYSNGYWQEISLPFDSDNLYFRRNVNGGLGPWRHVWHNGNFNPGNYNANKFSNLHSLQIENSGSDFGLELHRPGVVSYKIISDSGNNFNICQSNGNGTWVKTLMTVNTSGHLRASAVYNAVWNDYAEYFPKIENYITEAGDIIALSLEENNEIYELATENHLVIVGAHSDQFGHLIGGDEPPVDYQGTFTEYNQDRYIPVGLVGRLPVKFIGTAKKGMKVVPSHIPGVGRQFDKTKDDYDKVIGYIVENDDEVGIRRVKIKIGK